MDTPTRYSYLPGPRSGVPNKDYTLKIVEGIVGLFVLYANDDKYANDDSVRANGIY